MIKIKETIKRMLGARGLSMRSLASSYENHTGIPTSPPKLHYKFQQEALHISELKTICDILGYCVVITPKGAANYKPLGIVRDTVAAILSDREMTQQMLREIFNERTGATFAKQSFSYKLVKENLRMPEIQEILDILGYEMQILDLMRKGEPIGITE